MIDLICIAMMVGALFLFAPVFRQQLREYRAANGYKMVKLCLFIFGIVYISAGLNWWLARLQFIPGSVESDHITGLYRCFTFLATAAAFHIIYFEDKSRHS